MKNLIACLTLTILSLVFVSGEVNATTESVRTELTNDTAGFKNKMIQRFSEVRNLKERKVIGHENSTMQKASRGIISAIFFISLGAVIAFILIMVFLV